MTPDSEALVAAEINRAHDLAERGTRHAAALSFATACALCTSLADADALTKLIDRQRTKAARERERFRTLIANHRPSGRPLVIFADSLGLPRMESKDEPHGGAEKTYPFMLAERLPGHTVNSFCQRYFTTRDVLNLIQGDPELGVASDVLVHVGLNDAPWRMFLEAERLSLDLLPEELKERFLDFVKKHRVLILDELPDKHYVEPADYRANLDALLETLTQRDARVMVMTTILPPVRFWAFTPGLQRNFARYNLILMDAAHRHGATLIDLDRLIWDKLTEDVLLPDGMHLSEKGHELVAGHVASHLS